MNFCSLSSATRRSETGFLIAVGSAALTMLSPPLVMGVSVEPQATMIVANAPTIKGAERLIHLVFCVALCIANTALVMVLLSLVTQEWLTFEK